jgi:hypothetical protein
MIKISLISLIIFSLDNNRIFCDCDNKRDSLDSVYKNYPVIFVGEMKNWIPKIGTTDQQGFFFHGIEFSTLEMIKGDSSNTFVVANENTNCKQYFVSGHKYLVYSYYDSTLKTLRVGNICSVFCTDITTDTGAKDLLTMRRFSKSR